MRADHLLILFSICLVFLSILVLTTMVIRRVMGTFPFLAGFVFVLATGTGVRVSILFYRAALRIPKTVAYRALFYAEWTTQLLELSLLVLIIYGLFSEAMRPFPGLQRIGKIIFRWVGAVSLIVALALSAGPELFVKNVTLYGVYAEVAPRFQQGINVLILCLLIFICFSIRPLGLTFRSQMFGVALGLGLFSTVQLVQAAWLAVTGGINLYSPSYAFEAGGGCIVLLVWGMYFALPRAEAPHDPASYYISLLSVEPHLRDSWGCTRQCGRGRLHARHAGAGRGGNVDACHRGRGGIGTGARAGLDWWTILEPSRGLAVPFRERVRSIALDWRP